ncbi:hypothetical protein LOZ65_002567 [Ophidiomyces ophidiicola]|nr:hypothetical protein LOZ65_002567 [Ophidiomyces ophidiicola]
MATKVHQGLVQMRFALFLVAAFLLVEIVHALPSVADTLPEYVLKYAPLIWIHSEDSYKPSDIGAQIANTIPQVNFQAIPGISLPLTLNDLDALNSKGSTEVFLTSKEGIRALPPWFKGVRPNRDGKTEGAISCAIVVTEREAGVLDAFYFYFYAYNRGTTVFGVEFGNHVGDWEHNMIRFKDGKPQGIWYSQHASGQAFTWNAVSKRSERPIGFSANGSHAVYATEGSHDHTIPGTNIPIGILIDECDEGNLWDPTLSAFTYKYDRASQKFKAFDTMTPVNWLNFDGLWGDKQLPDSTEGQINLFGQRKYTSGPNGPKFKGLDRNDICPPHVKLCRLREKLILEEDEERELRRIFQIPDEAALGA